MPRHVKQRVDLENAATLSMLRVLALLILVQITSAVGGSTCTLKPLWSGYDDTDQKGVPCRHRGERTGLIYFFQVEAATIECGQYTTTEFEEGEYNIAQ